MSETDLQKSAAVFKALGHPSRLLMVKALGDGEKCVCDLRELVGADLSTVSKHLSVLKAAGIVAPVKRGNFVYYRLLRSCVMTFIRCLEGTAAAPDETPSSPAGEAQARCGCAGRKTP